MVDSSCIFCRIAAREIPADILRESERVMAFRDIDPQAPTHILLIPKEHVESVAELDDGHAEMLADLMQAATHLAKTEGIAETGWRLVTNVGPDAGQDVFHLHFHLLGGRPMTLAAGLSPNGDPGYAYGERPPRKAAVVDTGGTGRGPEIRDTWRAPPPR